MPLKHATSTMVRGYALMELLAAFLLISGGAVALMQTQLNGALTERDLQTQFQANMLLGDMHRKLDILGSPPPHITTDFGLSPPVSINCRRSFCDTLQLANFYLAHWKCRLGKWSQTASCQSQFGLPGLLPDGDARIQQHGDSLQITVQWLNTSQHPQHIHSTYVPL